MQSHFTFHLKNRNRNHREGGSGGGYMLGPRPLCVSEIKKLQQRLLRLSQQPLRCPLPGVARLPSEASGAPTKVVAHLQNLSTLPSESLNQHRTPSEPSHKRQVVNTRKVGST